MSDAKTDEKRKPGRPVNWRKAEAKRSKLPAVYVEEELEEWVVAESKRQRISMSNLIRIALWEKKERGEEPSVPRTGR